MNGLAGLWLISIIMAAAALAIMSGLIVGRWIGERRGRDRAAERKRLVPLLLGAEASSETHSDVAPASPLLTDLTVELIQLVRGGEKDRFIASAGRLGVPARLRKQLVDRRQRVRLSAAEALADFPGVENLTALTAALDDRNPGVRLTAALALTSVGSAPPAKRLVEKLGIGTRESSTLVVGMFEEIARRKPEEIRALVEDPQSPAAVRAAAIEALSASGDYSLVPVVAGLAMGADPKSEELPRYLRALGHFAHPGGGRAVLHWMNSDIWWVRAAAAEAAGRIRLVEAAPALAVLLDDPDWWVRFRAGEALVRLDDLGQKLLEDVAHSGNPRARQAASLTLAERISR